MPVVNAMSDFRHSQEYSLAAATKALAGLAKCALLLCCCSLSTSIRQRQMTKASVSRQPPATRRQRRAVRTTQVESHVGIVFVVVAFLYVHMHTAQGNV